MRLLARFLLVDKPDFVGRTGNKFGAELEVLDALQKQLQEQYAAPTVLLVIQGGPGTLDTMLRSMRQGIVTVLAADSGKLATAYAEYMRNGEIPEEWASSAEIFTEIKSLNEERAKTDELEGTFNDKWPLIQLFYLRGRDHIGEAILEGVFRQSSLERRLQYAVDWNRADLLEAQLSAIPAWKEARSDMLKGVLQQALELERPEMVSAALHHGAPAKEIDLYSLYTKLEDEKQCKYPLFYPEANSVEPDLAEIMALSRSSGVGLGSGPPTPNTLRHEHRGVAGMPTPARRAPADWYKLMWEEPQRNAMILTRFVSAARNRAHPKGRAAAAEAYQRMGDGPSPPPSPPAAGGYGGGGGGGRAAARRGADEDYGGAARRRGADDDAGGLGGGRAVAYRRNDRAAEGHVQRMQLQRPVSPRGARTGARDGGLSEPPPRHAPARDRGREGAHSAREGAHSARDPFADALSSRAPPPYRPEDMARVNERLARARAHHAPLHEREQDAAERAPPYSYQYVEHSYEAFDGGRKAFVEEQYAYPIDETGPPRGRRSRGGGAGGPQPARAPPPMVAPRRGGRLADVGPQYADEYSDDYEPMGLEVRKAPPPRARQPPRSEEDRDDDDDEEEEYADESVMPLGNPPPPVLTSSGREMQIQRARDEAAAAAMRDRAAEDDEPPPRHVNQPNHRPLNVHASDLSYAPGEAPPVTPCTNARKTVSIEEPSTVPPTGAGGANGGGGGGGGGGGSPGLVQGKSQRRASIVRRTPAPVDGEELWPSHFYPRAVWDFLEEVIPGLNCFWRHKMEQKAKKYEVMYEQLIAEGQSPRAASDKAKHENRLGVRLLDLYVWAVLLGNTELAKVLLGNCDEPMRAAILGARVCNHMAENLPVESFNLLAAAREHEEFAVNLLDLCANQTDAAILLLTPSRHWERNVLELGVYSEMKQFLAHRHCQNIMDTNLFGDVFAYLAPPNASRNPLALEPSCAMLPHRLQRDPHPSDGWLILANALCPCILKLRRTPGSKREPRFYDFYNIPYVKQVLRKTMYILYVFLFSLCVVGERITPQLYWGVTRFFFGMRPATILACWTCSHILDEWNQWVVNPQTFEIDMWNAYDYVSLSATSFALAIKFLRRALLGDDEGAPGGAYDAIDATVGNDGAAAALDEGVRMLRMLRGHGGHDSGLDDGGGGDVTAVHMSAAGDYSTNHPLLYAVESWTGVELATADNALLAFVNILVWCRVLQHFSTSREIGVLIIMIIEMASDMRIWMLLSVIFTLAFMVTFAALGEADAEAGTTMKALEIPIWAMFGDFDDEWTVQHTGMSGIVMLWVYVLVSNVLLVNLLIAMMSDTYQEVKENADVEWKFAKCGSILEAIERTHPIPPPFSFPIMLMRLLWWIVFGALKPGPSAEEIDELDRDAWQVGGRMYQLKRKRATIAKDTLQHYRRQQDENKDSSADGRLRRIEKLVEEVLIFSEDHEREIKYVKDDVSEIKGAKQATAAGMSRATAATRSARREVAA